MQRIESPHGQVLVGEGDARALMRVALGLDCEIGRDDRGAPVLPAGWVGSISHKRERAAVIVAPDDGARIGIDLEVAQPSRQPIERRVLTAREVVGAPLDVVLYFALKEAIYKAVDPFVRRYVGFQEVEVDLAARTVTSALPCAIEIWWCEHDGHFLATARARSNIS